MHICREFYEELENWSKGKSFIHLKPTVEFSKVIISIHYVIIPLIPLKAKFSQWLILLVV